MIKKVKCACFRKYRKWNDDKCHLATWKNCMENKMMWLPFDFTYGPPPNSRIFSLFTCHAWFLLFFLFLFFFYKLNYYFNAQDIDDILGTSSFCWLITPALPRIDNAVPIHSCFHIQYCIFHLSNFHHTLKPIRIQFKEFCLSCLVYIFLQIAL